MNEKNYFTNPSTVTQKKYEALRAYFVDELPAKQVANKFGYTYRAMTSLIADFRKAKKVNPDEELFFQLKSPGRKVMPENNLAASMVIELRKKYLSVPDIKVILDGKGIVISEKEIFLIIKREGFGSIRTSQCLIFKYFQKKS
ncbi:MAG: hypothetical protein HQK75_12890, partial [Candidatus Magnetomorum sp.]|nr:hypothetical protein [Candidatus Magnetomorum sp.]